MWLLERRLIRKRDRFRDRLLKNCLCCFDILFGDLKTNASDQVGHLPIQPDEIFVFEKTKDPCGFNNAPGHDCFR